MSAVDDLRSAIEAIAADAALFEDPGFAARAEAIDDLEFSIIDRADWLLQTGHPPEELLLLRQSAERLRQRLEAADDALFQRLRADIRAGGWAGAALRDWIDAHVGRASIGSPPSYDSLDVFVSRLLLTRAAPQETMPMEPEMVRYQPTPARIMLELVERAQLTEQDVFCDIGSGLGHVPLMVHLLSGAAARGVEYEPAYCEYARACAADLCLSQVAFIHADARTADYSAGTVFFMYTPCMGGMLQDVLERLRAESQGRRTRIFTYGPCTPHVSRQSWLSCADQEGAHADRLCLFSSR